MFYLRDVLQKYLISSPYWISVFIFVCTFSFSSLLTPTSVIAHGVDSATYTTIIIPENDGKIVKGSISIPWNLAVQIPKDNLEGLNPAEVAFTKYILDFEASIKENLTLLNNGSKCSLKALGIPEQSSDEILFGLGVIVDFQFDCSDIVENAIVSNIFFTNLPHHTNSVTVYKGSVENLFQSVLLTSNVTSFTIGNVENEGETESSARLFEKENKLLKLTSKLTDSPLPILLCIVFILGFLHTLEAGHSKAILGGMMVNNNMSYRHAILYSLIFTVTHIADIVILGVILLVTNSFVDIYSKLPYLQEFSLYALFFISLFLVLKSISEYVKELIHRNKHRKSGEDYHHDHNHNGAHNHEHLKYDEKKGVGQQLLMGFVAGLAPCIFGWSIFMAILSTNSVLTLFPIILSFGLGIFLSLVLFAFIVWKLKKNFIKEGSVIANLSPIISSLILLIYSLSQII